LVGSDPQSQPLTYSATGLPPGLSLQASTGYISGTGTTAGTYNVTARASDGTLTASQQFTWIMNATTGGSTGGTSTPPPPTDGGSTGGGSTGPDSTRPTIAITGPTSGDTFSTSNASITVTGIASDNVGVARVMFSNDQTGVLGQASGTTNWSTSIPLAAGTNHITVRSYDAAGNQSAADYLVITRGATTTTPSPTQPAPTQPAPTQPAPTPGSSSVRLGTSIEGITAYLEWTGASWPTVDVYRNGVFIQTTANDGYWAQYLDSYGRFEYTVCAPGSLTACSNASAVSR
jgi:hypothetical protein